MTVSFCFQFLEIACIVIYFNNSVISYFEVISPISATYLEPNQTSKMEVVNYFRKKALLLMFDWIINTPLHLAVNLTFTKKSELTR